MVRFHCVIIFGVDSWRLFAGGGGWFAFRVGALPEGGGLVPELGGAHAARLVPVAEVLVSADGAGTGFACVVPGGVHG